MIGATALEQCSSAPKLPTNLEFGRATLRRAASLYPGALDVDEPLTKSSGTHTAPPAAHRRTIIVGIFGGVAYGAITGASVGGAGRMERRRSKADPQTSQISSVSSMTASI